MSHNKKKYEHVNHPSHYNRYGKEVLEMMKDIWGAEKTALWCEMTAFKYRMRMGLKPDNPIEQDLKKEEFYLNEAKKLYNDDNTNAYIVDVDNVSLSYSDSGRYSTITDDDFKNI